MSENPDVQVRQVEALERIADVLEEIFGQQERIAFALEASPDAQRAMKLRELEDGD